MENAENLNRNSPTESAERLRRLRSFDEKTWQDQDLEQMAVAAIDVLCIRVNDGMDATKAIDTIYRFSHCVRQSTCYDVHDSWRAELKEFYKKEFIDR